MKIKQDRIKNILVIRTDRFGEFLLNIPAFRALKESFPAARLIAAVNPYVKELAGRIPFIDEVVTRENKKHTWRENLDFIRALRAKEIDMALVLNPSKESHAVVFLAGIPIRAGYDRKWGILLTHRIKDRKHLAEKHEVEYNLELAASVGAETKDKALVLRIDDGDSRFPDMRGAVAVHPWTSDKIKQWPVENFLALAKKIAKELNKKVIIVGGNQEGCGVSRYFDGLGENIVNLTGKTTLIELASLLKNSAALISGDSGPVHLAACFNIPVVAIFRNDIQGKGSARWGPRSKGSIVLEKPDLSGITVDSVFNKTKEIISR